MNKLFASIVGASLLLPVLAAAQSALDGTWKADLSKSQLPKKPDVYLLQDGMYECKTCVPPIRIKADGHDQNVSGHPYYDTMSIKIIDDRNVATTRNKNGKTVIVDKMTVAADGSTAQLEFTDSSATNADPVTGKVEMSRVAKGPTGSHAISGSWRTTKLANFSNNGITLSYKTQGDILSMTTPTGQSYTAKLDGTPAPYEGDPGITTVSVKKLAGGGIEETDMRDGKPVGIAKMTANGKVLSVTYQNVLKGNSMTFTMKKM